MSLRINTNVAALNAYGNLSRNQINTENAFAQLSSGLRINKAADDAAGLSIAQGLTSQINGLTQAVSNANDGINVSQIADGALGTTQDILQRMRGLVVKAGNEGTQDAKSLGAIQQEIQNLNTQLNNIAEQTKFGQVGLLDGTYNKNFQVGANGGDTIRLNLADASVKAVDLGVDKLGIVSGGGALIAESSAAYAFGTSLLADSGTGAITGGSALATVLADPDVAITATAVAGDGNGGWNLTDASDNVVGTIKAGANGTFTISKVDGDDSAVVATVDTKGYDESFTMSGVTVGAIMDQDGTLGAEDQAVTDALTATFGAAARNGGAGAYGFTLSGNSTDGWTIEQSYDDGSATVNRTVGRMDVQDGVYTFSDTNGNVVGGIDSNLGAEATASLAGYGSAQAALDLDTISAAIETVSAARSQIGAVQNQLSYTVANLQTGITNVTASRSNLTDADLAEQVGKMTQSQILTQAATSVLAQANSAPQAILRLLQ